MSHLDILEIDTALFPEGTTPLHIVASNKDTERTSSLLDQLQDDQLSRRDKHGRTPLCIALQNGRFEVAHLLIKAGANLEANFAQTGRTLTDILSESIYRPLLLSLVYRNIELPKNATYLQTLLHPAAYEGDDELLWRLLANYNLEVESVDHMSRTPLHYASQAGHMSAVKTLLEYGATVCPRDSSGATPLHLACAHGHVTVLELLLQEWVCPDREEVLNIVDSRMRTCTHEALYRKQFKVLGYLLKHFKDFLNLNLRDNNGHTLPGLLHYFCFRLNLLPSNVTSTLPFLSVEEATWTLHSSVHKGDLDAVERCVAMAELDTFDHMLYTPLMLASKLGHLEICEVLINAGANPNIADHVGRTPLQCACESGHLDVVAFLFSLHAVNPAQLFDSFSQTLSPGLLKTLLDYFSNSTSARKPAHWHKWLSLAARNPKIKQQDFSNLVSKICPQNWLQLLSMETFTYDPPVYDVTHHLCLPSYIEEDTGKRNGGLMHTSCSNGRGKEPKKKVVALPSFVFKRVSTFKKPLNLKKRSKLIGRRRRSIYCPIHEAAASGNSAALGFILGEAKLTSVTLRDKLLLQTTNESGQTVVELMARHFPQFGDFFDSLLIEQIRNVFGFVLPDSMTYEVAILHYLIVSNGVKSVAHFAGSSKHRSLTPLDKW